MNTAKLILFDFFGVLSTPCYYPIIKQYIPIEFQKSFILKLDELDIGRLSEEGLIKLISQQIDKSPEQILEMANSNSILNTELLEYIKSNLVGSNQHPCKHVKKTIRCVY